MTIESVTFVCSYTLSYDSYALDFTVSMAHTGSDQLSEVFEENYQPGTLEQVFHSDSLFLEATQGELIELALDTPFQYNGEDNLLIDIYYPDGYIYYCVWSWIAGDDRSLCRMFMPGTEGPAILETGSLHNDLPYMVLEGGSALDCATFGSIKALLGTTR